MVPIGEVFAVRYGNKLDANKLTFTDQGVNFVSRSSKNLGVVGCVELVPGHVPNDAGLITVTMGGTYLLSAFVQPEPFYTAQNIKVLTPLQPMSLSEKAFYCRCIVENRRRYSTHGREANRSFELLLVPSRTEVPSWAKGLSVPTFEIKDDHKLSSRASVPNTKGSLVRLDSVFDVRSGLSLGSDARSDVKSGPEFLPYVRPSKTQTTSFVEYVDSDIAGSNNVYPRHTLYVSTNGQGSHTYAWVSVSAFVPNSDVSVLLPKRSMSLQEKLYYAAVVSANRRLFSYGRKPKGERLKGMLIPEWAPHFVYVEQLAEKLMK
ncbi:hypothetical protein [Uliginosibacterium sp. 31-12]|uniref:hypothetical protein n=1 Tax=Uliginosibacterium sp. 31-12 TaxID=3062781 RepID=UPI0026E3A469|nr:hypothetical protein [Uliginosibacterium sp. 31-12]MDO6387640.1 hypothetical protein [Uliginosibacterium sp. 31-12]